MRELSEAKCSCGGEVVSVEQTPEEQKTHNCGRGCCGFALACKVCKVRFVVAVAAPDY